MVVKIVFIRHSYLFTILDLVLDSIFCICFI